MQFLLLQKLDRTLGGFGSSGMNIARAIRIVRQNRHPIIVLRKRILDLLYVGIRSLRSSGIRGHSMTSHMMRSKPVTCKLAGRTGSIFRVIVNVTVNIKSQKATRDTMW